MQLTIEQIEALDRLGTDLESSGWMPQQPIAESFDVPGPEPQRRRLRLALAFLRQYDTKIREVICKGTAVKPEILAATTIGSAVADGLQASGGFPVPVWTITNTLCQFGLGKYCALAPRPD